MEHGIISFAGVLTTQSILNTSSQKLCSLGSTAAASRMLSHCPPVYGLTLPNIILEQCMGIV